jgi:hypothetical protein
LAGGGLIRVCAGCLPLGVAGPGWVAGVRAVAG